MLYRRHEKQCRFRNKGVRQIKCACPVWFDGTDLHGKRQRASLKTRSWSQAEARLAEIENGGSLPPAEPAEDPSPLIEAAIASFLEDCAARDLAPATLKRYRNTLKHLAAAFAGRPVARLDLAQLTRYRAARAAAAGSTRLMELGTIRSFFRFCADRDWIARNPAKALKPPKPDRLPTMPFTADEVNGIIAACDRIENPNPRIAPRSRPRCRALVFTLLYSGMRISDVIKLERSALDMKTGRLLIRMMKTRVPLYIRLPPVALDALAALPAESKYFFWSGKSTLETAIGVARRTLARILKLAGIDGGHPHRFRDTFSVELLANGAELRTVQLLLGHTSIRTTEKHYAPFVASMQRLLDDAVAALHFGLNPNGPPENPRGNVLPFRKSA